MSSTTAWRISFDELSCDLDRFRLVVRLAGGKARYLVLRHGRGGPPPAHLLVASGIEEDVRTAMTAAERMAGRLRRLDPPFPGRRHAGPGTAPPP